MCEPALRDVSQALSNPVIQNPPFEGRKFHIPVNRVPDAGASSSICFRSSTGNQG